MQINLAIINSTAIQNIKDGLQGAQWEEEARKTQNHMEENCEGKINTWIDCGGTSKDRCTGQNKMETLH